MRKWRELGRQLPSRAVAVATRLSVRAPQKSCSQKGGRKNSAASQPPAIPIGTRRSFAPSAGPCSQSHKTLFGVRQWGSAGSSCSCRCWCQDPRGNPGVPALQPCRRDMASDAAARGPKHGAGLCPHGGKIMIVLVFMGHNITSVGGSAVAVALRGRGRL